MGDVEATAAGQDFRGYRRGGSAGDPVDQYVVPVEDRIVSYRGRAGTFRIPGRAGTAGQKLFSIHNATGSSVIVDVEQIAIDVYQTAARVVAPPVIRAHRVTVLPTNGSALAKVPEDTGMSSSSSVTLLQDASADGTGSGTTLTATIPSGSILSQEPAARALTLVGYEQFDRIEFFVDKPITLRALEGIVVNLDYTVATSNPVTDMWFGVVRWSEWTRP
jgi:hypothetical protein